MLITGAAHGIGAESARRLAARGARLALLDVDAQQLERVAAECPGSAWFTADVTDEAALRAAVEAGAAACGGLDVVIANAGIAAMGSARTLDPSHFERTIEVNLLGAWRTLHAALPHVLARRGYLLAVCSVTALAHVPGLAAYSASKAGLEAMCDALRSELAHHGVDVGVAYLSWIDTAMARGADSGRTGSRLRAVARPPFHRVYPVSDAGTAILRAVEHRAHHVGHPRWLPALLPARGVLQALLERELRARGSGSSER